MRPEGVRVLRRERREAWKKQPKKRKKETSMNFNTYEDMEKAVANLRIDAVAVGASDTLRFVDAMVEIFERELDDAQEKAFDNGYSEGHREGVDCGYDDGFAAAIDKALDAIGGIDLG